MTLIHKRKIAQDGFTLIELMIAVAIIGILAAVVVPNFMGYLRRAKVSAAKTELKVLADSILNFNLDTGRYPARLNDLVKRPTEEDVASKWQGPYLKKKELPKDPWTNRYVYKLTPGQENPYELYSYGPNGRRAPKAEWIRASKI
jgi:general secretion pathway protein G